MIEQFIPFLITCIIAIVLLILILIFLHKYEKKRLGLEGKIKKTILKEKINDENKKVVENDNLEEETLIESNEETVVQEEVKEIVEENKEVIESTETINIIENEKTVESNEETIVQEVSEYTNEELIKESEINDLNVVTTTSTKFVETTIYNKSFNAQIVLQSNLKPIYKEINNEFLSYKNVHARLSFKCVRYSSGRKLLAKMFVRGKKIYLYYALNPYDQDSKYHLKDVSEKKIGEELPSLQKVLSPRSVMYAKQLIEILMSNNEIVKLKEEKIKEIDYTEVLKPRSFKQLLEQGLIKAYKIKQEVPEGKEIKEKPKIEIKPEEVDEFVTDDEVEEEISYKNGKKSGKQAIINIGILNEHFDEEDEVTLEKLIEKKLLPKDTKRLKVLAYGILDKGLNVVADDYSKQAIKMIIYMGGSVTILK